MFDIIERIAKIIQNLAIIFGIVVSGATLVYTQYEKRVDRSIEYKKDFNSIYLSKFASLSERWDDFSEKDNRIFSKDKSVQEAVVTEFYSKGDNRHDLSELLDFFDSLWVCVHNHSCDKNASIELFGGQVKGLFEAAAFYIKKMRVEDRDAEIGIG